MNYLLVGFLISFGWYLGRLLSHDLIGQIIYKRVCDSKWFRKLENKSNDKKPDCKNNKIGF